MASANPEEHACNVIELSQRIDEHSAQIGALTRSTRATHSQIRDMRVDMQRVVSSNESLAEQSGVALRRLVKLEEKIDGISSAVTTIANNTTKMSEDFRKHQQKCHDRHCDIDDRLESMHDVELTTGVFEMKSASEIKDIVQEERSERRKMQVVLEQMRREADIHRAEKKAVADAKRQWEKESQRANEERGKLKNARYGMYSAIGVAIITVIGTIVSALL